MRWREMSMPSLPSYPLLVRNINTPIPYVPNSLQLPRGVSHTIPYDSDIPQLSQCCRFKSRHQRREESSLSNQSFSPFISFPSSIRYSDSQSIPLTSTGATFPANRDIQPVASSSRKASNSKLLPRSQGYIYISGPVSIQSEH